MPKTWYIHMSNPILIYGNTYMSKPLYISFKVAEFWGVLSLRCLTSHILSCFFCSFTSASISSNCNSWCAVISLVHTFCVLLQEEELLSCGIPRVDKGSTGVQSSLPACQHLGECLWHAHQPLCSQPWIQVPQYAQSSYSRHFPLISVWSMFKEFSSLPMLGSCQSGYIPLIQAISVWEMSSDILMMPLWIFCYCVPWLAMFSHLLKAFVRKGVKMGQKELQCLHALGFCCLILWDWR